MKPWKGSPGCSPDATFRADTFAQTGISETGGRSLCRDKACYGTWIRACSMGRHGSCGEGIVADHYY